MAVVYFCQSKHIKESIETSLVKFKPDASSEKPPRMKRMFLQNNGDKSVSVYFHHIIPSHMDDEEEERNHYFGADITDYTVYICIYILYI